MIGIGHEFAGSSVHTLLDHYVSTRMPSSFTVRLCVRFASRPPINFIYGTKGYPADLDNPSSRTVAPVYTGFLM